MDDCLDSYIVAACMHLLELSDVDAEPIRKQQLFDILPQEEHYQFISNIAKDILEKYIKITDGENMLITYYVSKYLKGTTDIMENKTYLLMY